jgi:hypothetical protein
MTHPEDPTPDPEAVEALIQALDEPPPHFARAALLEAMGDEILGCTAARQILRSGLAEVSAGQGDDDPGFAPVYALLLLGHHQDTDALELLLDIARRPERIWDAVLGDAFTEHMGPVLWQCSDGEAAPLFGLLGERSAHPQAREAAARALCLGVLDGEVRREDVVLAISSALDTELGHVEADGVDEESELLVSSLASALTDISVAGEDDARTRCIDRAFALDLVDGFFLDAEWRDHQPRSHEEVVQRIDEREASYHPSNPMALEAWGVFGVRRRHRPELLEGLSLPGLRPTPPPSSRRPKTRPPKDKARRKQARKSRKRNRGKRG